MAVDLERRTSEKKDTRLRTFMTCVLPMIILIVCVVILVILLLVAYQDKSDDKKSPTHIIYMMPDDLGYNDVGWHDDTLKTPHLSNLAENGVKLDNFYTMSVCSPSRAALMTGRYSSNVGGQHFTYLGDRPHGVPTYYSLLPERLQEMGYATYGVGKWHLGFCNSSYLPTNRGFDHFYGFFNGGTLFYEHTNSEKGPGIPGKFLGIDLHDDETPAHGPGTDGVYTSELFQDKTVEYIRNHDPSVPMFLYLAYQQPHAPLTVPKKWEELYPHIENERRRTYSGQISLMDDTAGKVIEELKAAGMYEDSLFVFHADNGGNVNTAASNWPYRGNKGTYFEGGIKSVGFVAGKGIQKTQYTHSGLFHISDIYPTLIEGVAGGTVEGDLDGINVWKSLSTGTPSPRKEMLITVDDKFSNVSGLLGTNVSAIRDTEWKLIIGWPAFSYAYKEHGWYLTPYRADGIHEIPAPEPIGTDVYLFNLEDDPYETNNLASEYPSKVSELNAKLDKYRETAWYFWPDPDPASNPDNYGGFWETGWC